MGHEEDLKQTTGFPLRISWKPSVLIQMHPLIHLLCLLSCQLQQILPIDLGAHRVPSGRSSLAIGQTFPKL
jgi:hypothetical protein